MKVFLCVDLVDDGDATSGALVLLPAEGPVSVKQVQCLANQVQAAATTYCCTDFSPRGISLMGYQQIWHRHLFMIIQTIKPLICILRQDPSDSIRCNLNLSMSFLRKTFAHIS